MKKSNFVVLTAVMILSVSFTSCGPGKKLVASQNRVQLLQTDSTNTHNQLYDCNTKVMNLQQIQESLKNQNSTIANDLSILSSSSKMTIAEQAARMKTLQDMLQNQRDVMTKLKGSISDALMKYKTDELYIYNKDGNVYVSLQEKLLFKSGSDVVDPKGKEALKTLAQVLNSTKDITVMIEGHTDSIPIKTAKYRDNWDLSTARATSIVRILTNEYGFNSNLITASGKSEYKPVKSNSTADGRAANRRTEVILSPDLKELYKLLE